MRFQTLSDAARALLLICVAAAAMEQLTCDGRRATAFRHVCALSVAAGVYRLAARLFD